MAVISSYWERMADQLNDVRIKICFYGADEHQSCDCKYGVDMNTELNRGECNGCPELRNLIKIYRNQAQRVSVSQSA